jgi:hypothetical protein
VTFGSIIEDGHWLPTTKFDPRVVSMYLRHYSAANSIKEKDYAHRKSRYQHGVGGVGQSLALITLDGQATFLWLNNTVERYDKQEGVVCTLFRNEGPLLSSMLVAEADEIAWQRWPDEPRHFTYVEDSKVASVNPGYCFQKAGWTKAGRNKDGRLTILEVAAQG